MSTSYSPKIVTDGLISYIDFGNSKSYSGSGLQVYDLINARKGSLNGNASYSVEGGGSLRVNNVDNAGDGVTCNFGLDLSGYSGGCICGWINIIECAGTYDRWFSGANVSTFHYPDLAIDPDGYIRYHHDGYVSWVLTGAAIQFHTWNYLSYNFSLNGKIDIYLNGNNIHSTSYSSQSSFTSDFNYVLGSRYDYNGEGINGYISNTQIYGRVLTSTEVLQNYNALRGRFGL